MVVHLVGLGLLWCGSATHASSDRLAHTRAWGAMTEVAEEREGLCVSVKLSVRDVLVL